MNTTKEEDRRGLTKLGKFLEDGNVSNVLVLARPQMETLMSPSLPLLYDATTARNEVLGTKPI
jgi:hypothetical protein